MKRILLIGGSGFIGSNIVKHIINKEYEVSILELPGTDVSIFNPIPNNLKIYYGKLSDYDFIKDIINDNFIDTVIHLASTLLPSSSFESYLLEFESIIKPTIKLLQLLSDLDIKFVYFSSGGTIYGNGNSSFSEFDMTAPISYYGQSKLIIEQSIKFENRRSGLKYLILRPSNPYGPGQKTNGKQGFIATSIGHILNNEKIFIWGDGSVVRDYINIYDLTNGTLKLIESGIVNDVFNIGSGIGYSINEIIVVLKRCIGKDFEIEYLEGRAVDVPNLVLNVNKFNTIASNSKIPIEQGISEFYNFELQKINSSYE